MGDGGDPALVVAEAIVLGGAKGFDAAAQLVHGHDAPAGQQPQERVGPLLPRGLGVFGEVDGASGQAAEVVVRTHAGAPFRPGRGVLRRIASISILQWRRRSEIARLNEPVFRAFCVKDRTLHKPEAPASTVLQREGADLAERQKNP